jgi:chromosome partitioning protein
MAKTHIIGTVARKGGTGKTTVAIHLAGALSARGYRVALVDTDIQGSALQWAGDGRLPFPVQALPVESERDLEHWGRDVRALDADIVVIDSPPHFGVAMGAVLGVADLVLVPCSPTGLDLMATNETLGVVREVRKTRKGKPRALIVPNRVDIRLSSGQQLPDVLKDIGEPVAQSLGDRAVFSDAFSAGQTVAQFASSSIAAREADVLALTVLKTFDLEKRK